jgi:integrase
VSTATNTKKNPHPGIIDRAKENKEVDKRYRYEARFRPSGTKRDVTRCFPSIQAAKDWRAEQRNARNNGTWMDPARGKTRLAPFARKWLATVKHEVKPSTHESYRSLLESRVLPTFGDWQLAAIEPSDVREWLGLMAEESLSASRRKKCLVVLRLVLDTAVTDRLLIHNPARDVKAPRVTREEAEYFEPAIVGKIAAQIEDEQYRLLVLLLGRVGFRPGEAFGLERRHVDLLRGRIKVEQSANEVAGRLVIGQTKTYAVRVVPVPPSLLPSLRAHLGERVGAAADSPLFTGPRGGRVRYNNFYRRIWKPALVAAGVQAVGLYALRHSAAAAYIASGANVKALQVIMGHRSVAFTLTV